MARQSLKDVYHLFNSRYFKSSLPKNILVVYSKNMKGLGMYDPGRAVLAERVREEKKGEHRLVFETKEAIRINKGLQERKEWRTVYLTLLHEMVHVKLAKSGYRGHHGHKFQREMKRLAKVGAFNNLW